MIEKILCIQLKQIGDVLMTTPAVRRLSEQYPHAQIHFLTRPPADEIFKYHPAIARIILYPHPERPVNVIRLIRFLQKQQYTTVIDFFGIPKTALLSWLTRAGKRIGFNHRGRSPFYTHPIDIPSSLHYSALQKRYLISTEIDATDTKIDFFLGDSERRYAQKLFHTLGIRSQSPLISISPVSRRPYKVWPLDRFAVICDKLIRQYKAQILFLWGPGEKHFVDSVRCQMQETALGDYDVPTIGETAAILERVDLHIGNDNGPMHFAIASGTPTVAVFGKPMARNWTPPDSHRHLAVEFDPGCKETCHYPDCQLECIHQITVASVWEKIRGQLQRLSAGKGLKPKAESGQNEDRDAEPSRSSAALRFDR